MLVDSLSSFCRVGCLPVVGNVRSTCFCSGYTSRVIYFRWVYTRTLRLGAPLKLSTRSASPPYLHLLRVSSASFARGVRCIRIYWVNINPVVAKRLMANQTAVPCPAVAHQHFPFAAAAAGLSVVLAFMNISTVFMCLPVGDQGVADVPGVYRPEEHRPGQPAGGWSVDRRRWSRKRTVGSRSHGLG